MPEKDSHLASYIDFDYFQHIVYLDVNQHVNQIYYPNSGTSWTTQDLTGTFGGNTAGTASVLAAFPTFGDQFMVGQHVAYLDGSDNVNQLYYPASGGTSWFWQNLTAAYNGNTPAILPVFSVSTSDDSGQNQ
jgi:hypothetical protein